MVTQGTEWIFLQEKASWLQPYLVVLVYPGLEQGFNASTLN